MGILGSAIGGLGKIAGGIFGGISASRAIKNVKKNINKRLDENQNWYDQRYNEDATQRADAQRILAWQDKAYRDRVRQAAGSAAVMGGTEEGVAATKAAAAEGMADATAQIAMAGDRRKDSIESQYQERKGALNDQLNKMELERANAISSAINGVANAGAGMASAIPDPKKWMKQTEETAAGTGR